jgi:elongation factor Tu
MNDVFRRMVASIYSLFRGEGSRTARESQHGAFRMIIANIYSLPDGTAVTGRIESGRVRVGDDLVLVGALGRFPVRAIDIHKFRKVLTEAAAGSGPIGITLSGVAWDQIRNRDVLVSET